jgi:hypothetical protein
VLLLIVLAVSAGIVIYSYVMGYLGGLGGGGSTPGSLSLDTSSCNTSMIAAYVRNSGKGDVTLDKAYVDGEESAFTAAGGNTISETAVKQVSISGTFSVGVTYEVKLVGKDNTQISFSVKCK